MKKNITYTIKKYFSNSKYFSRIRNFQPIVNPVFNPPKKIFLIRHAEHEGNIDSTAFYRKPDHRMNLTEKGIEECGVLGKQIKEMIKDDDEKIKWFISPYKRCIDTCEILSEEFGGYKNQDIIEEPRLREQEWGNLQDETWPEKMKERRKYGRFFYRFKNGESGSDVYDRVSAFLESLYREFNTIDCPENFIFISHGFTLRMFLARWFRWTIQQFEGVFNFKPSQFVIMKRFNEFEESYYKIINEIDIINDENDDGSKFDYKNLENSFLNWPDDYV